LAGVWLSSCFGFDVRILYDDPQPADAVIEQRLRAQRVSRDQLLANSDILSLHAPLTEATRSCDQCTLLGSDEAWRDPDQHFARGSD